MITVSIPVPYPLAGFFQILAVAIARWNYRRWLRSRSLCPDCEACGAELEASTERLIQAGHYHAAICLARMQLERRLKVLCKRVAQPRYSLSRTHTVQKMLAYLRFHGIVNGQERHRVGVVHGRVSKVVHNGKVNRQRAITLVRDVAEVLEQLDESNGIRVQAETPGNAELAAEVTAVA